MKFRDRYTHTETERFTPRIPWGLLTVLVFFMVIPFALGWILKYTDEIDSTKMDLKVLGWILVASVILVIFRRLIWKAYKFLKDKGKDLPNFQD